MATRSTIAKLGKDGIIKAVYCHNDGYLDYNGRLLNTHYTNEDKVDKLLAEGDISSLGREIGIKVDFNKPTFNEEDDFAYQCKFYARDKGGDLMFNEFESDIEYLEWANDIANGFIYLYAYGAWYVYDNTFVKCYGIASYRFVELEEALQNEVV
mgnify:CR=1 FL=1